MTIRAGLANYLRTLLEESTPTTSPPPTSSPVSTPPTTTPNTTTAPAISEAAIVDRMLETMERMQERNLRETRELVVTILQGRETELRLEERPEEQPSRTLYDPPDYDAPGTDDLPAGLQAVFEREQEIEPSGMRQLRTEQEALASQLTEARMMAGLDPQGPIASERS